MKKKALAFFFETTTDSKLKKRTVLRNFYCIKYKVKTHINTLTFQKQKTILFIDDIIFSSRSRSPD